MAFDTEADLLISRKDQEIKRLTNELTALQNDYLRYIFGNFDQNAGWGRELWLCCWMTGALHDYMTVCRESFHLATYVKNGGWGREFFLCCWMTGCWFNQFLAGYREAGDRMSELAQSIAAAEAGHGFY